MTPEFSRPYRLDELGGGVRAVTIEANEAERAALAVRFGLIQIDALAVTAELVRENDAVVATGKLRARVVQACVASGAPVPAKIAEDFALRFLPEAEVDAAEEIELHENDLDVIPYEGSAVDLGEAAAQTLALALDPFPRAPDAEEKLRAAGVIGEADAGPFAALKALRDKL
ncbi:MAG TPA: YceD family protein [Sphingomonas sp.]|uniref:YceD family protein n=1 Tax=Sphingomonas sp. TaxID=28214 RepID=UPI002CDCC775|nr:YceD family protein [Sphingomonas sp.]HMI21088.1 YceD family protein [Sphingomonas sp.]